MKMENSYYVLPGLMPVTLDDQRIENLILNLLPSPIPPACDSPDPLQKPTVRGKIRIRGKVSSIEPNVDEIIFIHYAGYKGDEIFVQVSGEFDVVGIIITIMDKTGKIVEEGICSPYLFNKVLVYTAREDVNDIPGLTIKAFAFNLLGMVGRAEVTM